MKQKVKFYLHGQFGEEVGPEWDLLVNTPADGLRLIEANTKKCIKFLADANQRSVGYSILVGGKPISSEEELNCSIGKTPEVHFIPVVEGAKSGLGKIIVGLALIVAVFVFQQYQLTPYIWGSGGALFGGVASSLAAGTITGYIASAAIMTGIGLIAGGAAQLITGNPDSPSANSEENQPSYLFNGPLNTTRQGNPVPICYGKILCGSALISLEINSTDITAPYVDPNPDPDDDDGGSGGGSAHSPSQIDGPSHIVDSPFKRIARPTELT